MLPCLAHPQQYVSSSHPRRQQNGLLVCLCNQSLSASTQPAEISWSRALVKGDELADSPMGVSEVCAALAASCNGNRRSPPAQAHSAVLLAHRHHLLTAIHRPVQLQGCLLQCQSLASVHQAGSPAVSDHRGKQVAGPAQNPGCFSLRLPCAAAQYAGTLHSRVNPAPAMKPSSSWHHGQAVMTSSTEPLVYVLCSLTDSDQHELLTLAGMQHNSLAGPLQISG